MRCPNCHYSLKNLNEHRCPERGHKFDPNDAKTFDAQLPIVHPMVAVVGIALFALIGLGVVLALLEVILNS